MDNKLGLNIERTIKELNKFKNLDYLIYLFSDLSKSNLLVAMDEKASIPVIVASKGNNFFVSCFTKKKEIPQSFIKNHLIKRITFKSFVKKVLTIDGIEGIVINHKSDNLLITKDSLRQILEGFKK